MLVTIFDVEAGGLNKLQDDLLSFAYVLYDDKKRRIINYDILYFYWPGIRNNPGAFEVNQLTMDFLRNNAGDETANFDRIFKIISRSTLVGYNSQGYDLPIILSNIQRRGGMMPEADNHLDLMKVYQPVYKKRMKLNAIMDDLGDMKHLRQMFYDQSFGKDGNFKDQAHDAAFDVITTLILYIQAKGMGYI